MEVVSVVTHPFSSSKVLQVLFFPNVTITAMKPANNPVTMISTPSRMLNKLSLKWCVSHCNNTACMYTIKVKELNVLT